MTAQALSDYISVSKYAQYLPDKKRRETAKEAGDRMFDMHRRRYPEAARYIDEAQRHFDANKILGSQRALQFGGLAIERREARGYNCSASYCDRQRFFQEAFWLLLCGAGVGFSVQKHHVAKLPKIGRPKGNGSTRTYVVQDSIEGWADAAGELMDSYFHPEKGAVRFDYQLIRGKGAPLSTGGRAPGPEPLRRALDRCRTLLDKCGERLRPIDAYDLTMHLSDAVLSGGIRRSSTLCLFSPDDRQMMDAKTGNWLQENPQRARSNNSALLLRGLTPRHQFDELLSRSRQGGDPGTYWSNSTEFVPNPCCEVGFRPVINGRSCWGLCNLSSVNVEACKTPLDFLQAARAAAILGTLQAGYTDLGYLGSASEELARRDALIGVSMTGIMRNTKLALDTATLEMVVQEIKDTNAEVALVIGINSAARCTALKPEGSGSLKLKTSSGMKPDHSRRYIRHVQVSRTEPPAAFFKSHNPGAVEPSAWSANDTDDVLSFCVTAPEEALIEDQVTALQMLENVRLLKRHWVDTGSRRETDPGLGNNVSNTINVRDHEWGAVADFIFDNQHALAGVALLAAGADLDYRQAPFVAVKTRKEIMDEYGMIVSTDMVDEAGDLWGACERLMAGERDEWCRRALWVADRFLGGDLRQMSHHVKDVAMERKWRWLMDAYVNVDYRQMVEEEDNVQFQAEAACAGGMCELV